MDRKIPLIILAIAVVVTAVLILLPGGQKADSQPKLPWQIEIQADGANRVFDLTLGQSTLEQARQLLSAEPTLSLFRSPDGIYAIEAYFQRATVSGLRADFIFTLDIDQPTAEQIFGRGERISQLGSGSKKVELSHEDSGLALNSVILHLTYIPATDLEPELIERHFGQPEQRIAEKSSDIEHWLYPAKGLGIAVNPDAKEVFQYLSPANFDQLVAPLLEANKGS